METEQKQEKGWHVLLAAILVFGPMLFGLSMPAWMPEPMAEFTVQDAQNWPAFKYVCRQWQRRGENRTYSSMDTTPTKVGTYACDYISIPTPRAYSFDFECRYTNDEGRTFTYKVDEKGDCRVFAHADSYTMTVRGIQTVQFAAPFRQGKTNNVLVFNRTHPTSKVITEEPWGSDQIAVGEGNTFIDIHEKGIDGVCQELLDAIRANPDKGVVETFAFTVYLAPAMDRDVLTVADLSVAVNAVLDAGEGEYREMLENPRKTPAAAAARKAVEAALKSFKTVSPE